MTFVVEIEHRCGRRAVKEYEATSAYALVPMIRYELSRFPDVRPVGAWRKEQPEKTVFL